MDSAAFLLALKQRATSNTDFPDPLRAAELYLQLNPNTGECQALRKLLRVLAAKKGVFHESDLWLFSGEMAGLSAALIDARMEGRYSEEDWKFASSL